MNRYMLLFFQDDAKLARLSPGEMQALGQKWMTWMETLEKQGILESRGERLGSPAQAKAIKGSRKLVSDGPYIEAKDAVGGYCFLKAESLELAIEKAKGCPIFEHDGSVELRAVVAM